MKLYSRKYHRHIECQVHFGVGNSVHTACGLVLFSRRVMVSIHSGEDGAVITEDIKRVTCKRCLKMTENRLRKLIEIEVSCPGLFDRDSLCGKDWLLNHALDVSQETIDAQTIKIGAGGSTITLSNKLKAKDRKQILKDTLTTSRKDGKE